MKSNLLIALLLGLGAAGCYDAHGVPAPTSGGGVADAGAPPPSGACDLGHCVGCDPVEELCHYGRVMAPTVDDGGLEAAIAGAWTACDGRLAFADAGATLELRADGRFDERDAAGRLLTEGTWRVTSGELALSAIDRRARTLRVWTSPDACTLELGGTPNVWLHRLR